MVFFIPHSNRSVCNDWIDQAAIEKRLLLQIGLSHRVSH